MIVTNEDFEKVKLKSTRVIEIEEFVDEEEISPVLVASQNGVMILYKLRYPSELLKFEDIPNLAEAQAKKGAVETGQDTGGIDVGQVFRTSN